MKKRKKKKVGKKIKKRIKKEEGVSRETKIVILLICFLAFGLIIVKLFAGNVITSQIVTSVPYECKDSDGRNPYNRGRTELYNVMEEPFLEKTYEDYCSDEMNVVEYYCAWENFNYVVKTREKECENGCEDGACIMPRKPKTQSVFIKIYENIKSIFER
jgi:hypothetical protein